MNPKFSIKKAIPSDLTVIRSLLDQHDLITDDLDSGIDFYVGKDAEKTVGIGGFEIYDSVALLRSVVMSDHYKGKGLGRIWTRTLMDEAASKGICELYLLTTTAPVFFEKIGFERIERKSAPISIQQTREFSELCPDSAVVMKIKLT